MITSHHRGNPIYWEKELEQWCYSFDGKPIWMEDRPCPRCNQMPTDEGHDACLGNLKGVENACCGHGVAVPYIEYSKPEQSEQE